MTLESVTTYDFANVLFAGPCNRSCPWCIGKQLPDRVNVENLDAFPPRGVERFIECVNEHAVPEIVFTGTISDPQLYRHEADLLAMLRSRLHRRARFSVHTNGVLALRKLDVFNQYDRACISFPSFEPDTYTAMMGSSRVPDLAAIVSRARIPVKVSCVLDAPNVGQLVEFLSRCASIGVRRVVLRRLFGETREWRVMERFTPVRFFKRNPVYDIDGMEVTYWDFDDATCRSINLFPDGTLGTEYLLTDTVQLGLSRPAAHASAP